LQVNSKARKRERVRSPSPNGSEPVKRARRNAVDVQEQLTIAVTSMASAMNQGRAAPSTPERLHKAIAQLEEEDPPLDDYEYAAVVDGFALQQRSADVYLSITRPAARRAFLRTIVSAKQL
jgi:hypothetical protein